MKNRDWAILIRGNGRYGHELFLFSGPKSRRVNNYFQRPDCRLSAKQDVGKIWEASGRHLGDEAATDLPACRIRNEPN